MHLRLPQTEPTAATEHIRAKRKKGKVRKKWRMGLEWRDRKKLPKKRESWPNPRRDNNEGIEDEK